MLHFIRRFLPLFLLCTCLYSYSQSLSNLSFGNASTFDVITWNLESFPKVDGTTENYVSDIITELEAEVIGLQEINNMSAFTSMMATTNGYTGYVLDANYGGINMAFAVKNDVSVINNYAILSSSNYNYAFAGRPPFLIHVEKNNIEYYVINVHLKCCGDGSLNTNDSADEENRRLVALNLIKSYIDNNLSDKNVLVIGDYNDELTDDTEDNVFQSYLDDENYLFVDMDIAGGNPQNFSFPNWPSHIDHILITNELFDEFYSQQSLVTTIQVDNYISGGFNSYDALITDHMPVGLSLVYANGCTDPLALNFNPDASVDDGSCTYESDNENPVLFISEYAEGSSNNKYLEIYNPTSSTVSLDNYAMALVVNDPEQVGAYDSWHYFDSGSSIEAYSVFIVAHQNSDPIILAQADMTTTHLSNGNDGIALVFGNEPAVNSSPTVGDYFVVDRIGDWNGNPGNGWAVAGVSDATKDQTLVRKCFVSQGNNNWTESAGTNQDNSEWEVLSINDWTNLGEHYQPCEIIIEGCTDPASINYNADATVDNGSCICCYLGCTDETATNYNPNAFFNDGSCNYIEGCIDSLATNYNPNATIDDGSCLYQISPCDVTPSGLSVNNIIHNRVQFNWNQPQELPSYYMIRYRPVGTNQWIVIAAGTQNTNPYSGTSRTRYFMLENTTYEWSARARVIEQNGTINCQSPWSATAYFTTLASCPNMQNLSALTESNWVTFSADSPSGNWGVWQSKGKIRKVGTTSYRYVNDIHAMNVTKGNFDSDTEYEWQTKTWCSANINTEGDYDPMYHSGWGDFFSFTTQEDCNKIPYNLSTTSNFANTSITMIWDTPESGAPDHYFLELTNVTTQQVWAWNTISGNSNSKTKYGLSPGEYKWRIRGACGVNGTTWATPFTDYEYFVLGASRIAKPSDHLVIFPNPSNDIFNMSLTLPYNQTIELKISDALGQLLLLDRYEFTDNINRDINLSQYSKGIYIVSIKTDIEIFHKKLFLQ